ETDPAEPGAGPRCRAEDVAGAKHHATGGQAPQPVERVLLGLSGGTVAEVDPEGADDADELHLPLARLPNEGVEVGAAAPVQPRTQEENEGADAAAAAGGVADVVRRGRVRAADQQDVRSRRLSTPFLCPLSASGRRLRKGVVRPFLSRDK